MGTEVSCESIKREVIYTDHSQHTAGSPCRGFWQLSGSSWPPGAGSSLWEQCLRNKSENKQTDKPVKLEPITWPVPRARFWVWLLRCTSWEPAGTQKSFSEAEWASGTSPVSVCWPPALHAEGISQPAVHLEGILQLSSNGSAPPKVNAGSRVWTPAVPGILWLPLMPWASCDWTAARLQCKQTPQKKPNSEF